jgi:predicted aspartyl protease
MHGVPCLDYAMKTIGGSHRRTAAAALALAALLAPPAQAACQMVRVSEIPVSDHEPLAEVSLDGHAARLLIDTGAATTALWRSVATAFHLDQASSDSATFYGAGGSTHAGLVTIHDFRLGDYVAHNLTLYTLTFGNAPPADADPFAGTLGEDFLARMDVEFDLGAGKVRLFEPKGCSGDQVVYWAQGYYMVKLLGSGTGHQPRANVSLNGHEVVAMFDSGSQRSAVTAELARRPGMAPESSVRSVAPSHGIGPKPIETAVAQFATLTIGQETIQNPALRIADLFGATREEHAGSHIPQPGFALADMLLGADFFRAHRVYIANSQGRIYFTYSGGPIFEPGPQEN